MKTTLSRSVAYVAMISAALLSSGCQKEEITPIQDQERAPLKVTATIKATPNAVDTKTCLDVTTMKAFWKEGDKIGISGINERNYDVINKPFTLSDGNGTAAGTFTEDSPLYNWPIIEMHYLAVYPYQPAATISNDHKFLNLSYPHIQYAMQGPDGNFSSGAMAARATSTGVPTNLSFQNLFSIIKISLTGTGTLTKVTFKDLSGKPVSGEYTLGVESGFPEFPDTPANDKAKSIELSLNLTLTEDAQDIYLAVPARTYTDGFEYVFCCGSQKMTKTISGSKTLEAGKYYTYNTPLLFTKDAVCNLSDEGTANCYIVTEAGDYKFDATIIGNGLQGFLRDVADDDKKFHKTTIPANATIAPQSAQVLWQDVSDIITNINMSANRQIHFTASSAKGNAVIAVYDGPNSTGNILWTWHIWCTDQPTDQAYVNKMGNHYTVMDRNLGAISNSSEGGESSHGLLYQWGRKDPFQRTPDTLDAANITDATTNGNIAYTISHPTTFITATAASDIDWYYGGGTGSGNRNNYLWGNPYGYNYPNKSGVTVPYTNGFSQVVSPSKTIYDPCPPGYIVTPIDTWTVFTLSGEGVLDSGLSTFKDNVNVNGSYNSGWNFYTTAWQSGSTAWYPAVIHRDGKDGKLYPYSYFCWSSSPYTPGSSAGCLRFARVKVQPMDTHDRAYGISVRCCLVSGE